MFRSKELEDIISEALDAEDLAFNQIKINIDEDDLLLTEEDPDMKIILDEDYEED